MNHKPKAKTEIVRLRFWACLDDSHRHRTVEVAQRCIDRELKPKKGRRQRSDDDRMNAHARFEAGESMASIGRSFGVCGQTIKSWICRIDRRLGIERAPSKMKLALIKKESEEREARKARHEMWMRRLRELEAQGVQDPSTALSREAFKRRKEARLAAKERSKVRHE